MLAAPRTEAIPARASLCSKHNLENYALASERRRRRKNGSNTFCEAPRVLWGHDYRAAE
jgi:hypothetical protein